MGRKSTFTMERAEEICEYLASGKSLASWCKKPENESYVTVCKWLNDFPEFAKIYTAAREAQADLHADEIVEIADEVAVTYVTNEDGSIEMKLDSTAVQRNRLRVDARKWVAAKLKPRKYSDKIQQEISGPDGSAIDFNGKIEIIGLSPSNANSDT